MGPPDTTPATPTSREASAGASSTQPSRQAREIPTAKDGRESVSDEALAWVRFRAQFPPETKDATALKYTLMEYAHEAKSNGDLAFLTMSELAARTVCDHRTARRRTARLVELGLLALSNFQDIVIPLFPRGQRPRVYRIASMPALPPVDGEPAKKKRKTRGPADLARRARRGCDREAEAERWDLARRYFDERTTGHP